MFAMVVTCKKEDGRETIVDQWDADISKATDTVVQTEYVCEELSTNRFEALVYWNLEKEQCFANVKQVRDFKLMRLIEYNNYSEGTRCFAK